MNNTLVKIEQISKDTNTNTIKVTLGDDTKLFSYVGKPCDLNFNRLYNILNITIDNYIYDLLTNKDR